MAQPYDVRVYYKSESKIDTEFDKKIREFIESLGYKWWAQGFNHKEEIRDIAFQSLEDIREPTEDK